MVGGFQKCVLFWFYNYCIDAILKGGLSLQWHYQPCSVPKEKGIKVQSFKTQEKEWWRENLSESEFFVNPRGGGGG